MLTLRLAATFALFLVPLALASADNAAKGDLGKFQGNWTTEIGPEKNIKLKVAFADTKVTVSGTSPQGDAFELRGEIKLDENAKPHKTLDWLNFTTSSGENAPSNLAIYMLKGDTLTVCSGGPGNERPTEFKAGEGGRPSLIVLTRE